MILLLAMLGTGCLLFSAWLEYMDDEPKLVERVDPDSGVVIVEYEDEAEADVPIP